MTKLISNIKNYKRFFNLYCLIGTIFIFLSISVIPALFDFRIFVPFTESMTDFQITDFAVSVLRDKEWVPADTSIVLINTYRMNNKDLAYLLEILELRHPRVIGIENILVPDTTEGNNILLHNTLSKFNNIILGYYINDYEKKQKMYWNISATEPAINYNLPTAYTNVIFGKGREKYTAREFTPTVNVREKTDSSFAVKIAARYNPELVQKLLKRKKKFETIYYRGNFTKFFFNEGKEVLENPEAADYITGKIVLLGNAGMLRNSHVLSQMYFTPANDIYAGRTYPDMYSLEVQANIISTIINNELYRTLPAWISALLAFILTYLNMYVFFIIKEKRQEFYELLSLLAFMIESFVILYLTVQFYDKYRIELRLTFPLFTIALSVLLFELYHDTLIPITKQAYYKLFRKVKQ